MFRTSYQERLHDNLVRCVLLLRLAEDVDGPSGLVGDIGNVEAPGLSLADSLNLLDVFLGELNLLKVLLDARRGDRLGDHAVAANLGPGKDDLCRSGSDTAGNLLDLLVFEQEGLADHVVSECL
jgi:hypothetical protein